MSELRTLLNMSVIIYGLIFYKCFSGKNLIEIIFPKNQCL